MKIARADQGGLPGFSVDLAHLASSDRLPPESVAPPRGKAKPERIAGGPRPAQAGPLPRPRLPAGCISKPPKHGAYFFLC